MNRFKRHECGQGVMEWTGGLLLLLGIAAIACLVFVTIMRMEPSLDVPLNDHSMKHVEAIDVQKTIVNCPKSDLKEFRGLAEFDGRIMWGCLMNDGKKVAFWVVILDSAGNPRTVTAFVSRSWQYAESLIEQGKYVLERLQ